MKNWLNKHEDILSKIGSISLVVGLIFLAYDLPIITRSIICINILLILLILKYRK